MERRNTIQRAMVLDAVRCLHNHPTADAVYAFIIKKHPAIGKGTVYRNLNILSAEGAIQKVIVPNGPDRFDHTIREHYHVQCIRCGGISDVDMDAVPDLMKHIHDAQGFQFLDYNIMFRGICPACQEKHLEQGAGGQDKSDGMLPVNRIS